MAMHFHDEVFLHCQDCNSVTMAMRKVYRFSTNRNDINVLDGDYLYTEIYCTKCGRVAKTVRNEANIRVNY